jgi:hypothetical protein
MCTLTLSASKPGCATPSGIDSIYLIDRSAREATPVTIAVAAGVMTFTGTSAQAYHIIPIFNTTNITNPITSEATSNAFKFDRTLEFKIDNYSASTVVLLDNIVKGKTEVLIKWVNGLYTYMGEQRGLSVTGGDAGTAGLNLNDPKGSTLTLSEEATSPMSTVDFTSFSAAFDVTEPS